jgi:hypothetical protein
LQKLFFAQVVVCMNYAPVQTKGNATNLKSWPKDLTIIIKNLTFSFFPLKDFIYPHAKVTG